MMNPLGFN